MLGIFGNDPFDIARASELDRHLEEQEARQSDIIQAIESLSDALTALEDASSALQDHHEEHSDELVKMVEKVEKIKKDVE